MQWKVRDCKAKSNWAIYDKIIFDCLLEIFVQFDTNNFFNMYNNLQAHLETGGEIAALLGVHKAGGSLCHCRTLSFALLLVNCNIKSGSISLAIPSAFVSVGFPAIASLSQWERSVPLLQREAAAAGSAGSVQVRPCRKPSLEKTNGFLIQLLFLSLL